MNDEDQVEVARAYKDEYHRDLSRAIEGDIAGGGWVKLVRAWLKEKNSSSSDPA